MRRLLALALLLTACASTDPAAPKAQTGAPIGVSFRQINGSPELYRHAGRIALQYIVTITNPSDAPFDIDHIEMRSPVPGAYSIRSDTPTRVGRTIPPKMGLNVPVNTWGLAAGGRLQMEEPVTVAVIVYGSGADKKPVIKRVQRTVVNFNERNSE